MATLMTQNKLKLLLLGLSSTLSSVDVEEADVIDAWTDVWSEYFAVASLSTNTEASASYAVDQTTTLKIGVNSYLGASDLTGTNITVSCTATGASEVLVSAFDTQNYVITTGLLGQDIPSTSGSAYKVLTTFSPTNMVDLKAAMSAAMVGLTVDDAFSNKLSAGINALWDEIVGSPSDYFAGATAVAKPSGITLSGLEDSIDDAIDANRVIFETPPDYDITDEEAMDNIAQELNDANTASKGTATVGGTPYDIG